jgi:hypothetical protein
MSVIRMNVPPDHTPEEEAALVADVAASYADSTGSDVTVEVNRGPRRSTTARCRPA